MSDLIYLSNATVKLSSIDGVKLTDQYSSAKIYLNGVSISVTDDMARKIKRLMEKADEQKAT